MTRILLTVLFLTAPLLAADAPTPSSEPAPIHWTATDATGAAIQVPDAARPTVVIFVMANQPMSLDALKQLKTALRDDADTTQVVTVLSGRDAETHADAVREAAQWTGSIVVDPAYAACELMNVHAWPTTVIVDKAGSLLGHVAGLPRSYQKDLESYLDYAHGRIDADALKDKLNNQQLVVSSTNQEVVGHLQSARHLLETGDPQGAHVQLEAALALQPNDPALLLTLARTCVLLGQPDEAIATLDKIEPGTLAAFQLNVVRGRALIAQEKWADARAILADSVRLNPSPAEAHYLLGLIEGHDNNWQLAAEHYRAAFEATHDAQLIGVVTPAE